MYHTTDAQGLTELNPPEDRLRQLLAGLDQPAGQAEPHPDVSLTHHSGWTLGVTPNGVVTWENLDREDPALVLKEVTRERALQLWLQLAAGEIDPLAQLPWEPG